MEYTFYNICSVYLRLYKFIFCIYYLLVIDSCTPLMETSFCGFRLAWKNKVVLIFLSYLISKMSTTDKFTALSMDWTTPGDLPKRFKIFKLKCHVIFDNSLSNKAGDK